jgi:hypothetical protein
VLGVFFLVCEVYKPNIQQRVCSSVLGDGCVIGRCVLTAAEFLTTRSGVFICFLWTVLLDNERRLLQKNACVATSVLCARRGVVAAVLTHTQVSV